MDPMQLPIEAQQQLQPKSKVENKPQFIHNLLFPKRSWTQEEDELLVSVVKRFGPHKWSLIARYIPNRMGKQCRERWYNHLNP